MDSDILFSVRNSFYLGAYQGAIAEAADLDTLSERQKEERDIFVYRSYIELGSFELVINEVSAGSSQALQSVRLLAQYAGKKIDKGNAVETLQSWLEDPATSNNATVLQVAGHILAAEGKLIEALKACHTGLSLELLALSVQILLAMNRVDQAEKQLKVMASMDEDSTLTQLATAWVNVQLDVNKHGKVGVRYFMSSAVQGGAKVQEAYFIYKELGDRYNWTVRLYNSIAVCNMRMGNWEEAEKQLQEAYEKDAKNAETIANLVCVGLHLGKNVSRHTNQLKTLNPSHVSLQRSEAASELFDNCATAFA